MLRSLVPWKERLYETTPWRRRFFKPLSRLEEEMETLTNRFFGREMETWGPYFTPSTDVVETENQFEVTLDLPGMKPEEVKVELTNGDLRISGERKEEKEEKGETFHRTERHYGEFRRTIPLPGNVDREEIEGEYKEGVLKVTIPKTEESKPKHIEVKS